MTPTTDRFKRRTRTVEHVARAWELLEGGFGGEPRRPGEVGTPYDVAAMHLIRALKTLRPDLFAPAVPQYRRSPATAAEQQQGYPPELQAKFDAAAREREARRQRRRAVVVHEGVRYLQCTKHVGWLPEEQFAEMGTGGRQSWCDDCMREKSRLRALRTTEAA
jgi:hypothetical protein